jgi:predicted Zn finger-like uncharacterized protein
MSETTTVQCPHCGQQYTMTPQQVGQTVRCTRCQQVFTAGASPQMAGALPLPGVQPQSPLNYQGGVGEYARPPATSGMAIASLVCGLLFCVIPVISSLLAIIFGIIGISKTKDPRVGGKGMSIAGLILGCVGLLMFVPLELAIMVPAFSRASETANRVRCASNMRMISVALQQYAIGNGNVYPPDFKPLLNQGSLTAMMLECPTVGPSSSGASPYVLAAIHPMSASAVILYEPVADHKDGANMLFGNGTVQFIPSPRAQNIINDVQSGINPPVH